MDGNVRFRAMDVVVAIFFSSSSWLILLVLVLGSAYFYASINLLILDT